LSSSSLGIHPLNRLSAVRPSVCPLQEAEASFGSTAPTDEIPFRPRGFSPPRRFTSHRGCGFVAPRYRLWGSTRFLVWFPVHPKVCWTSSPFPAPRVVPSEEFPLSAAVPHHCGRYPLAIAARSPCLNPSASSPAEAVDDARVTLGPPRRSGCRFRLAVAEASDVHPRGGAGSKSRCTALVMLESAEANLTSSNGR
jgi:hypothetical protein